MLPFGLKLAWFALSLSGLIGCWAVLLPLAWAMGSYWGPIAYAVGITGLEGIFCIGLVWKMNPVNMPVAFCIAQTLITGSAAFFIIGVLAAITTATTIYVAKPKQWGENDGAILSWRTYYLLPIVLFPLLASCVHITFVIFFGTFEAIDGLTCMPNPLWLPFVGHAGTPFLLTIPCLWLTFLSTIRVRRTHQHIQRARRSVNIENLDRFTTRPRRKSRSSLKTRTTPPTPRAITAPSPSPSSIIRMTSEARRQPISPVLREEKIRSFHLPFLPPSPDYMTASSGQRSQPSEDSFDTVSSVSFAEIKRKSGRLFDPTEEDDVTTPLRPSPHSMTRSTHISTRSIHNSDRLSITQLAFSMRHQDYIDASDYFSYADAGTSVISGIVPTLPQTEYRNPAELSSVVRSLIIFQFAIIFIHLLSSITPLIDAISARSAPAALGTQHVALLLAGWAPVVIFGG
ncbi:hypothetical protein C8R43DRAFT_962214 [Mycena crocata]|nr:hypothetical protein C8R43DRAFT_962214 [Mycena crocata]